MIKAGLETVAEEIKKAATEVVSNLAEMLKKEVELKDIKGVVKVVLKKVPVVGTAWQIYAIEEIIRQTAVRVMELVEQIKELTEALQGFLAAVVDPGGAINEKFEDKLAPITDRVKDGAKFARLSVDIAKSADMDGPCTSRPRTSPWESDGILGPTHDGRPGSEY